ncbi:MAG TPA: acetyl-CoA decarbonylase/synthase complex subunit delta [Anaerolineae bacterium]|nr:acetyl-CoA decarbonylase/synthase complex subunit delta [Anaerolineae bacterium]HIQ04536.1 acetyl-CoA decarbonylase/synthase complex subunit delta [Anaerolineae bacterium]
MPVSVEVPKERWTGKVREITLGATPADGGTRSHTVTVGGETTLPFLLFEGEIPHPPRVALEVRSSDPNGEWSQPLLEAWGDVVKDPAEWAKAAEDKGADLVLLQLTATRNGSEMTAADACSILRDVLQATGLPLLVFGPGQVDLDNELLVAVAEEGAGERMVLGVCEEKNYRTIVAAALAHNHLVDSRTPMDVNLAKQLIILIHDMQLPLERILMDPTTGALGYGIEYGYSVMERLRLAALQGDSMTQQPMLVTPGEEAWRAKEARVGTDMPEAWGDWTERAITWETLTATTLIHSGADVVILRHPESMRRVHTMIEQLLQREPVVV